MRILFMGTPDFALPALAALNESAHEVVAVYSQPPRRRGRGQKLHPSPTHHYALEHHIAVETPIHLKDEDTLATLKHYGADIAVVAAYGLLLPYDVLHAFVYGCINLHPSALPRWRGAAPIPRTIEAGDRNTSMCIMQMDEGLDTGDILLEHPYTLTEEETAQSLHDTMATLGASLVLEALDQIAAGTITPKAQSDTGVSYAHKIAASERPIDWKKPVSEICCHIRAMSPYPGATCTYHGESVKILQAHYDHNSISTQAAGTILQDTPLAIAAQGGTLYPTILQRAGKKPMEVAEFCRGFSFITGEILS